MSIGEEFEPRNIHAYQLLEFTNECEINSHLLERIITNTCHHISEKIDSVITELPDLNQEETDYIERYKKMINKEVLIIFKKRKSCPKLYSRFLSLK